MVELVGFVVRILSLESSEKLSIGPFYEWVGAGTISVKISGFRNGTVDLSSNTWVYKIGLEGEHNQIQRMDGMNKVKWLSKSDVPKHQPLTWYKTTLVAPSGIDPIGLDMKYMGKGQAWLNGEPIGRYWPRRSSRKDNCSSTCNYRGKFFPNKCYTGCGEPTQRWYHVPLSWFRPTGNTLVIFEEKGGDPTKISFSRRRTKSICGFIFEDHPSKLRSLVDTTKQEQQKTPLHLACPSGTAISSINFASFGTPVGACGSYSQGACHYPNSVSVVERACLHKEKCFLPLSEKSFGKDLCPGMVKGLAVEAACS